MVSEFTNASGFSIRAPLYVSWAGLLDDLIRPQQERLRGRQPEWLDGREVDDQLGLRRRLHRQGRRVDASKELRTPRPHGRVVRAPSEVCLDSAFVRIRGPDRRGD